METLLAVTIGGGVGSAARYALTLYCESLFGREFPYGIFLANVVGSFAIGLCFVFLLERATLPEIWRPILMVGFLGGFTTFSTFSLQTVAMIHEGQYLEAAAYILGSVILSIAGAWAGILLARQLPG